MQHVAETQVPSAPRYGWFSALGALLAGSIVAFFPLLAVAFALGVVVHILPGSTPADPGRGWPWRIDGAWSAFADLGPLLFTGGVVAAGIGFYVGSRTGRRTARWPIALCATLVGWIPITQGGHNGLLGVSGGLAFLAMWWTTRKTSEMARPELPTKTHQRIAVAAAATGTLTLAAVSLAYGTLHPIRADFSSVPATAATLHGGKTDRFPVTIYNQGPLPVRILAVSLSPTPDLRLARVELLGPRREGPTIDSLYSPLRTPTISTTGDLTLWLTLTGPSRCNGMTETLSALDVRVAVAGLNRVQRVLLGPTPVQVNCRPARRP
jgi:hypothetical protein